MSICLNIIKEIVVDKPILFCKRCGVKDKTLSKNKILCNKCLIEQKKKFKEETK